EKVLIWLLRWTGLRLGEALALTVEDVDLERRVVRVRASKTDAGLRTVPIVDELGAVLLAWIEGLRARKDWRPDMPLLATRGSATTGAHTPLRPPPAGASRGECLLPGGSASVPPGAPRRRPPPPHLSHQPAPRKRPAAPPPPTYQTEAGQEEEHAAERHFYC